MFHFFTFSVMHRHLWKCLGVMGTFHQMRNRNFAPKTVLAKTPEAGNISVFDLTSIKLEADTYYENYEIGRLYSRMEEVRDVAE